jgi:hypothetical protein
MSSLLQKSEVAGLGGSKGAALISFILNIKKDFAYLSFTSQ